MADLLNFSTLCNRDTVSVTDQPQLIYVLTQISPGSTISKERLPLNFSLVLDRSGSMVGEKLRTMKEAVKDIIEKLNEDDIVSVVTFETRTDVLVSTQLATDKKGLIRLMDKIRDGGGTKVAPALKVALQMVSQHAKEERVSRIVLLTDGVATDREQDSFIIADEAGRQGIPIVGLGFGKDWKEEFLFELADRSILTNPGSHTGFVDYIPKPEEAVKIFQEVYQSMQVVARDVTVTLRMVQGLEARRIWQVVPMIRELGPEVIQGRAIQIPLGQLERSGAAFLAEIMLPPRPEGAVRIAQTDVSFTTSQEGMRRQSADLILNYSKKPVPQNQINGMVMNVVEKVQAFRLQTQALDDAQSGDISNATRKLRQAVTILLSQGETELADHMEHEADRLEQSGEVSSEGKKTIMLTSRKTVRLSE
jgi:Ca-activated chloride channel family protein